MIKKIIVILFLLGINKINATTYSVTNNTGGTGLGSLGYAIIQANGNGGLDTIVFAIGAGIQTIRPTTSYAITDAVFIDGTTQPSYSMVTYEPLIQIDGENISFLPIFDVTANGNYFRGIIFTDNNDKGIQISASNNKIENCWFGLDSTGITSAQLDYGIYINGNNNTIGGATLAQRCVFAGILNDCINIDNSFGNIIKGNYIGVTKNGTEADTVYSGSKGVTVSGYPGGVNNEIGMPGIGNYISGFNQGYGVFLVATHNINVRANFIGLSPNNTDSIPNSEGMHVTGICRQITVGGNTAADGNFICGNNVGIYFISGPDSNAIVGNTLGYTPTGIFKPNYSGIIIDNVVFTQIGNQGSSKNIIASRESGLGINIINSSNFNKVVGNYIGTNETGLLGTPERPYQGINIQNSHHTIIGGPSPLDGNVFGNLYNSIYLLANANNTLIQNNFIGVDVNGVNGIINHGGILSPGPVIDSLEIRNNVISSAEQFGVYVEYANAHVNFMGNKVGTNAAGTSALPNFNGFNSYSKCKIGSSNPVDRNIFCGNTNTALALHGDSTVVQGNYFGVAANGTSPLPNNEGIALYSNNTLVGGMLASEKNIIANQTYIGIYIHPSSPATTNCKIIGNEMYKNNNSYPSIDILETSGFPGQNINDLNDVDNNISNRGQNYPDINCVSQRADLTGYDVNYSLNSEPSQTYLIEIYADSANQSLYGQGRYLLGRQFVTTNAGGNVSASFFTAFDLNALAITLTATDTLNNVTSEFSPVQTVFSHTTNSTISCGNQATGIAVSNLFGGVLPYSYLWNTGATTDSIINLSAGTYIVQVQTSTGCNFSDTLIVTAQPAITIGLIVTPSNCGSSVGAVSSTVGGGAGGYSYYWSNGATTANINSLFSGQYLLQVTDANGCYASDAALVFDSNGPTISLNSTSNLLCNGNTNGAADVSISGGTAPYTFLWSNNTTNEDLVNAPAGSYDLTVNDVNGCFAALIVTITEPTKLSAALPVYTLPSTCNSFDGAISTTGTGGTAPYVYSWDPSTGNQTSPTANLLGAGVYELFMVDVNGCTASEMFALNSPGAASIAVDSFYNAGCNLTGGNGAIYTSTFGVGPYTYLWSNGNTSDDVSGLAPGNYGLTVTDINTGCKSTLAKHITGARPGVAQICMLTVDTATNNNLIIWNDAAQGIMLYEIFRETSVAGAYNLIASIPPGLGGVYEDTLANPDQKPWRYKISTKDSCGYVSNYSLDNKTIHCNVNLGGGGGFDLDWDAYQGTNMNFTHYRIYRKIANITNWTLIDSVLATQPLVYTDLTSPAQYDTNFYFIETNASANCNTVFRLGTGTAPGLFAIVNTSRSNIKAQLAPPTSINQIQNSNISVYPNPAKNEITISAGAEKLKLIELTNVIGQIVLSENANTTQRTLNISQLANGVYFVNVITENGTRLVKKVVKEN